MKAGTNDRESPARTAARLILTGRVQGIGVRPAVARWAQQLALSGYVANSLDGVEIHVEGPAQDVSRFEQELPVCLPAAAELSSLRTRRAAPVGHQAFVIALSDQPPARNQPRKELIPNRSPLVVRVPPDVAVCDQCLAEVSRSGDRRFRYPFTCCTDCGPRFSLVDRMPYERARTGMAEFELCVACRQEYETPSDRRFHAQGNACPKCGPQIWLRDDRDQVTARGEDTWPAAAGSLRRGQILALRGLGGYQLMVDAASPTAVARLRRRKRRRGKPLAVMVRSLEAASDLARLDAKERKLLASPAGPIVVASVRSDARLAEAVTCGLDTVGLMLPTTPLHALLLKAVDRPVVCTSANAEGDPLAFQASFVFHHLSGIADLWLEHNRPIRRPVDDSVVRVIAGRPVALRLARGYAPRTLPLDAHRPVVALGGHQKSSLALGNGIQAVLGPHIGDLDTVAARERFLNQLNELTELYGVGDCQLAGDRHPEYFATQWAEQQAGRFVQTQHHHAHIVAGMLENGWLDRQTLGVAFDGTGYGDGGEIWGGEFLLATVGSCQRVGHLRPFRLPGGEAAIRQPWRVATALVEEALGAEAASRLKFQAGRAADLLPVLRSCRLSPVTTSAGRLFDGIAALILRVEDCQFEGQAAMLLEAACDRSSEGRYPIVIDDKQPRQLDWRPLVRAVWRDLGAGVSPATAAMRFHRSLADAIHRFCGDYFWLPVVLGGGVFQNRLLGELLAERFASSPQPLGLPGLIPPNDGGLAAGQLAIAVGSQ